MSLSKFVSNMLISGASKLVVWNHTFVHVKLWGYLDKPDCCSVM
jgi:hypothetical protein